MTLHHTTRPLQTEAYHKFYLTLSDENGKIVELYGPFDSKDILSYYYDALGEHFKTSSNLKLSSVALKTKQVEALMLSPKPVEMWEHAREVVAAMLTGPNVVLGEE